jgi:hypothetical protein
VVLTDEIRRSEHLENRGFVGGIKLSDEGEVLLFGENIVRGGREDGPETGRLTPAAEPAQGMVLDAC